MVMENIMDPEGKNLWVNYGDYEIMELIDKRYLSIQEDKLTRNSLKLSLKR